jgi:hypothetical protein
MQEIHECMNVCMCVCMYTCMFGYPDSYRVNSFKRYECMNVCMYVCILVQRVFMNVSEVPENSGAVQGTQGVQDGGHVWKSCVCKYMYTYRQNVTEITDTAGC